MRLGSKIIHLIDDLCLIYIKFQWEKKTHNLFTIEERRQSTVVHGGFCEGSWWFTMIWNLVLIPLMGHDCFPIGFAMGSLCFLVDFMVVCNDLILFSFMGDGGFVVRTMCFWVHHRAFPFGRIFRITFVTAFVLSQISTPWEDKIVSKIEEEAWVVGIWVGTVGD